MKPKKIILMALFAMVFAAGCQSISDMLLNMQKLQFKLDNVNNFQLAGVNLSNKSSISDFSITEALQLTRGFTNKNLPATFIINVAAKNPNDGTKSNHNITLSGLDWRLLVDGKETITGGLASPVGVPAGGQTQTIPLSVSMNLYDFFAKEGYNNILNLALALGGVNGSAARLSLDAQPTISTPLGSVKYPSRITIVDKEFR